VPKGDNDMEGLNPLAILLVEDDEDAREILAMMLTVRFPQVAFHSADNGKTGLEIFRKHQPAIVITDVNMPIMNGICLAEEIQKMACGVKFIVLTAFSDKTVLESSRAVGIGIDHHLMKPVDCQKLLETIRHCLAEVAQPRTTPHPTI